METIKRERFSPFPLLSCKYGAPMGRVSGQIDPETPIEKLCVSSSQGEYDYGGAYWGYGGRDGAVYAVWVRGKGRDGVVYVRAKGTESAKRKALELDV